MATSRSNLKKRGSQTPHDNVDKRHREPVTEATYIEHITVAQVSDFIREQVQRYGIQAKTANRYREVLRRLFSWSMDEGGVRMPGDANPVAKVRRYTSVV